MRKALTKEKLLLFVACILVTVLAVFAGNTTVVSAASKKATVSTQKELNQALKDESVTQIILKSEKVVNYTIKKGDYSKKQLNVYAPKATVTNSGTFKKIYIKSAVSGQGKWIEKASGNNQFIISSKKARIDVPKNAVVKSITIEKQQSHVTVTRAGKIAGVRLKKSSELVINSDENTSKLNVNVYDKNCRITDLSSVVYLKNSSKGTVGLLTNAGELTAGKGYTGTIRTLVKKFQQKKDADDTLEDEDEEEDDRWSEVSDEAMQKAKTILSQIIKPGMSEYAKVQTVYEWLTKNVVYDKWYTLGKWVAGSPEGALLHGRAICSGYSETFQLFMDLLGIQCKEVSGQADGITYDLEKQTEVYGWGGHAWNLVCIDGNWYHVDATWDAGEEDVVDYEYFLLTDEEIGNKKHKDWETSLPAATKKADFWDEYIALAGDQLKKVNSVEEVQAYFDKYTEVGSYKLKFYAETPLWYKIDTSYYPRKRKDVLSSLKAQLRKNIGNYYFFNYQFTIEMKYDEVTNTNRELVNFVQNEAELFEKLDALISTGEDLVYTTPNYSLGKASLAKWADQRGYYTTYELLQDNIQQEKLSYKTGDLWKITIPRKCFQCSPQEDSYTPEAGVHVVYTKEEFEAVVAPLFEDPIGSYAFNAGVVPMWECTEDDILAMLNEIAVKYGYTSVKLLYPIQKRRVSYSHYSYGILAADIALCFPMK